MSGVLSGRSVLITGGSQGLGLEIAKAFVRNGANVQIGARSADDLERACAQLAALATDRQSVFAETVDVSEPQDVDRFVRLALTQFPPVSALVNNAGIYGPKGPLEDQGWLDWVRTVEINLLGSVLMCRAILPHFKAQGYGKIIQLSGGGATTPMPLLSAYAASKAAVVRFAETLAEEVRADGIDVNAIAPGPLNTRMLDEVLEAGPEIVGQAFYERAVAQRASGGTSLEAGAELAVFLASAASDGITGKLISAVWDPWEEFADHREALQSTDIYTLRRIVPRDRGLTWADT